MKQRFVSILAGVLSIFMLASCTGSTVNTQVPVNSVPPTSTQAPIGTVEPAASAGTAEEKVVRRGASSPPSGIFNPLYNNEAYTSYVIDLVFESLLTQDENANLQPKLAERWEVSEDSKTVTFYLYDDIRWSDGVPFTAEDVRFTIEHMSDKNYTGLKSTFVQPIAGFNEYHAGTADHISGINVIDDYTIAITTEEIYASLFQNIGRGLGIIAKHVWENVPVESVREQSELLRNPVGTGPFKIFEYVPDQYTILSKNEDYHKGSPKLDKFVIQVVNTETVQAQLLNGSIDLMNLSALSPDEVQTLEDSGLSVTMSLANNYSHLIPNLTHPLLNNKDFRHALLYAIDREGIVATQLYGFAQIANNPYNKESFAYPGDGVLEDYAYNPEKALDILTNVVGLEFKNGVLYSEGKPVSFRLSYSNKGSDGTIAIIQQNLKALGIEIKPELVEFATQTAILTEGNFDLASRGSGFSADGDGTMLNRTGGSINYSRISDAVIDGLLDEGVRHLDVESRTKIYKELAVVLNDMLPALYLYHAQSFTVVNPSIKNVIVSSNAPLYTDIEKWDIE